MFDGSYGSIRIRTAERLPEYEIEFSIRDEISLDAQIRLNMMEAEDLMQDIRQYLERCGYYEDEDGL